MSPDEKARLTQLLLTNAIDYWYEVDHHDGLDVDDYYLEDATFFNLKGRAAIHQFYVWRKNRGARTARHLITNFRAQFETPRTANTQCVLLLFAADGKPVLPSAAPIQIADQNDTLELCDDGRWRFRSRAFINIFRGDIPTTVPPRAWYEKYSPESLKE